MSAERFNGNRFLYFVQINSNGLIFARMAITRTVSYGDQVNGKTGVEREGAGMKLVKTFVVSF